MNSDIPATEAHEDSIAWLFGAAVYAVSSIALVLVTLAVLLFVWFSEYPHTVAPSNHFDVAEPILNSSFRRAAFAALVLSVIVQFLAIFVGAQRKSNLLCATGSAGFMIALLSLLALHFHGIPR